MNPAAVTVLGYPELLQSLSVVLASQSPRRLEILQRMGFQDITIIPSTFREDLNKLEFNNPSEYAKETALLKGQEIAQTLWDTKRKTFQKSSSIKVDLIISADTIVVFNDQILEKPKDKHDAINMLTKLNSSYHEVITAVSLFTPKAFKTSQNPAVQFSTTSKVKFGTVTHLDIQNYVATGEPLDKAGGYGIQGQGGFLIESIEGCFYNVQGLPFHDLSRYIASVFREGLLTIQK